MKRAPAPAVNDPADEVPCTAEQAATLTFEALAVEMPDRAQFMEHAENAFVCIRVGAAMPTKNPAELAVALKTLGESGIVQPLDEVNDTRQWFAGFVEFLEGVEARILISASRVAVHEPKGFKA